MACERLAVEEGRRCLHALYDGLYARAESALADARTEVLSSLSGDVVELRSRLSSLASLADVDVQSGVTDAWRVVLRTAGLLHGVVAASSDGASCFGSHRLQRLRETFDSEVAHLGGVLAQPIACASSEWSLWLSRHVERVRATCTLHCACASVSLFGSVCYSDSLGWRCV